MSKLRVRAVGDALVTDFEAMQHGIRRFIGRKLVLTEDGRHGFESTGVAEVDNLEHYRIALRYGDLEACDAETAAAAGVPWPEPKKAQGAKEKQ